MFLVSRMVDYLPTFLLLVMSGQYLYRFMPFVQGRQWLSCYQFTRRPQALRSDMRYPSESPSLD